MATITGRGGILNLRWSYNQVSKDPKIDEFRTIYQKVHIKEDALAALAGLSTSTVKNMFGGQTRRPQHLTYEKLAAAMHHEFVLQPISNGKIDYDAEIALAREERKSYRALMIARRERKAKKARKKPA
jgi:hypothetical protein